MDAQSLTIPSLAKIYAVFEIIKPDYHLDLHTFSTLSIPFIFLDR